MDSLQVSKALGLPFFLMLICIFIGDGSASAGEMNDAEAASKKQQPVLFALGVSGRTGAEQVASAERVEQSSEITAQAITTDATDPSTTSEQSHVGRSISGQSQVKAVGNSAKSVEAELVGSDEIKPAVFPEGPLFSALKPYYDLKKEINRSIGLNFRIDYSALFQRASWTESGDRTGASQVFRILGDWLRIGDPKHNSGELVWKTEVRTPLGGNPTPRDLGFDTGSALSTANFKELDWGVTNLYWKQRFEGGQYALLVGHLDPGDWADQYPHLNAWTSFMNDAFYNNPSEAIPSQGFAIVGQAFFTEHMYVMAGVADANGKGGEFDFSSFWHTREWFSWAEIGFRENRDIMSRHNAHLHYWHQDARQHEGTSESWGVAFTYSEVLDNGAIPFIRAGYSEGNAPQLGRFVGIGATIKLFGRDVVGLATSWGSPPDSALRSQFTSEVFYRLQLTQNLALTPDIQLTYNPSFNVEKDWVAVAGLRMRLVF